ncbi:TPA: indole-3-glycerol phosphate synthase TrpC [Candidatus Marinimicrobia bacterium]|nr:MAG: Indole-3-glycerol phosphate synthase [Marinimicrobia bacterium 46_47]KUK93679.1 MAG: Indole-3-glycerol phosphate synthase [Marinimicrobia bacterium 46_43]HAE87989.1 indole-3-glycerol phosphate synthase TrpC [Candidatus Neomarinimicrobiota bacterium]HBY18545.1 indole-3-glycerol phosphate synthase TrpC [Candidatus Neomarinimicrobiota bacterium]
MTTPVLTSRHHHFLNDILSRKQQDLDRKKTEIPISRLKKTAMVMSETRSLYRHMTKGTAFHFICEIKMASPSRGIIRKDFNPVHQARFYEKGGASAVSVLTEEHFFRGHPDHVRQVRQTISLPILYKDFIIDPYQVYEAKAAGADVILLIAALLSNKKIRELSDTAEACGLEILFELHNREDLDKIPAVQHLILGINNRDLRTFQVDPEISFILKPYLPEKIPVISESGIKNPDLCRRLAVSGFRGALVGESLMRAEDPIPLLNAFLSAVEGTKG